MKGMRPHDTRIVLAAMSLALASLPGCSNTLDPADVSLVFAETALELGGSREAVVDVSNTGSQAFGPIELLSGPVQDEAGATVPGWSIETDPDVIATLDANSQASVTIRVRMGGPIQAGRYEATITASTEDMSAELSIALDVSEPDGAVASITIEGLPGPLRQGDVTQLSTVARDGSGTVIGEAILMWSVGPPGAGFVDEAGRFVGYWVGSTRVVARSGSVSDAIDIPVEARDLTGSFEMVGEGPELDRYTSDLWLHGVHAYLGTWGARSSSGAQLFGNRLYTWDVSDPANPVRTGMVQLDARTVNDVKVHPDGHLAIVTHEGSGDDLNGITLLDLSDPAQPVVITRFTEGLEAGVHNSWIAGSYAYVALDGVGSGLRVLDISDPADPRVVASFWAGESTLHDVYLRDGLAFLSHWNAGLVILDVGNGTAGGSPEAPVEVSRIRELGGQTHNAWYWPESGYVFLGEEDFGTPGHMRVVDLADLSNPQVVATFQVSDQPPHNYWLDEERAVLYLAWYGQGVRALDVSGELLGDLSRQGREIVGFRYRGGSGTCGDTTTCTWAPQLHDGLLYLSDRNVGLVVLRPTF